MNRAGLWMIAVLAMTAGFIGGILSSWLFKPAIVHAAEQTEHQKLITAERFVLVDATGTRRAELGMMQLDDVDDETGAAFILRAKGPALTLYDTKGNLRSMLAASTDGATGLGLLDEKGELRVSLGVAADDTLRFAMCADDGVPRAWLVVAEEDDPYLALFDTRGDMSMQASLYVNADGSSGLVLSDKWGGTARAELSVSPDDSAFLKFEDDNDKARASLGVDKNGAPSLTLQDSRGAPRATFWMPEDGSPALSFRDKKGNERSSFGLLAGLPYLEILDEKGKEVFKAPPE